MRCAPASSGSPCRTVVSCRRQGIRAIAARSRGHNDPANGNGPAMSGSPGRTPLTRKCPPGELHAQQGGHTTATAWESTPAVPADAVTVARSSPARKIAINERRREIVVGEQAESRDAFDENRGAKSAGLLPSSTFAPGWTIARPGWRPQAELPVCGFGGVNVATGQCRRRSDPFVSTAEWDIHE
jgi:hypothetical protein